MKKKLFEELLTSIRQGGAIIHGERKEPDSRRIRENYRLSQEKFAHLMGISVVTLRNWEQGRRTPEGSAKVLLKVAAKYPEAVLDVVQNRKSR